MIEEFSGRLSQQRVYPDSCDGKLNAIKRQVPAGDEPKLLYQPFFWKEAAALLGEFKFKLSL